MGASDASFGLETRATLASNGRSIQPTDSYQWRHPGKCRIFETGQNSKDEKLSGQTQTCGFGGS